MPERGEFTRKFDREILNDDTAEAEERAAQQRLAVAQDQALEAEFSKIMDVLDYRAAWLRERFPSCKDLADLEFRGRRFEFARDGKPLGSLEFKTRLTDSQQGIMIQSTMQLEGHFAKRCDYISFPKERVNIDKAKRFVESKIFEFAGPLSDVTGR